MIVDGREGRPCADLSRLLVSSVTSLRASHPPTRLTCVQAIQVLARNPLVRSSPSGSWWRGGRAPFSTNYASPTSQQEEKGSWSIDLFLSPFQERFSRKEEKKKKGKRQAAAAALFLIHYPFSIVLSPAISHWLFSSRPLVQLSPHE